MQIRWQQIEHFELSSLNPVYYFVHCPLENAVWWCSLSRLSVCNALTFESLDLESLYLLCRCIYRTSSSVLYSKVMVIVTALKMYVFISSSCVVCLQLKDSLVITVNWDENWTSVQKTWAGPLLQTAVGQILLTVFSILDLFAGYLVSLSIHRWIKCIQHHIAWFMMKSNLDSRERLPQEAMHS